MAANATPLPKPLTLLFILLRPIIGKARRHPRHVERHCRPPQAKDIQYPPMIGRISLAMELEQCAEARNIGWRDFLRLSRSLHRAFWRRLGCCGIRKLQASSPVWQASVYNCNAFTADIARSMGFKTPPIWLRPQQFMTRLREMNTASSAAHNATRTALAAG